MMTAALSGVVSVSKKNQPAAVQKARPIAAILAVRRAFTRACQISASNVSATDRDHANKKAQTCGQTKRCRGRRLHELFSVKLRLDGFVCRGSFKCFGTLFCGLFGFGGFSHTVFG